MLPKDHEHLYTPEHSDYSVNTPSPAVVSPVCTKSLNTQFSVTLWTFCGCCLKSLSVLQEVLQTLLGPVASVRPEDAKAQKAIKPETASSAKIYFWINQLQLKCKPKEGQLGQQGTLITSECRSSISQKVAFTLQKN